MATSDGPEGMVGSCQHCGEVLGSLDEGWESITGRVVLGPDDLGARVDVHRDFVVVACVCPHCLTALRVDTEPVAGKTWRDFALRNARSQA